MSFAALGEPGGANVLVAAVQWVQGTLLGTVATAVAVICVAVVGLMMLSGRISYRRALEVILGCFILFGASSIAAGLHSLAGGGGGGEEPAVEPVPYTPPPPPPPPPPAASNPDPYAGAAVPNR